MLDGVPTGTNLMQSSLAQALENLHARIAETVLGLGASALDWHPAPSIPTVRELVIRAATEERRWVAECVLRDLVEPACRSENDVLPTNHPLYELGCVGQISQTVLTTLTPLQWGDLRQVDDVETSVAGCLLRTLELLAHALGQLELIAALWSARKTDTG